MQTILSQLDTTEYLSTLINTIVQNYLVGLYSICILWHPQWNYDFAYGTEKKSRPQIVSLRVSELSGFQAYLEFGMELNYCQGFVVFEEDIPTFLRAYAELSVIIQRRFSRYHFVFVLHERNNSLENILNDSLFEDAPDILFIEKCQKSIFHLSTTKFKGPTADHPEIILLDTYNGINHTFSNKSNLFPNKLTNLMGRPLRAAVFTYKPYMIVREPDLHEQSNIRILENSTNNGTYLDGTEGRILLNFCKKHNCTLDIFIDEEAEWGLLFPNYTGTGLFGALLSRKVDVILCALYLWYPEYLSVQYSKPITRTGISCLVPAPKRIVSWFLPLQPFSLELWIGILIVFLAESASLGFFYYLKSNGNQFRFFEGISKTFRFFLSQSAEYINDSLSERILILCCLLIGFVINNIYGSGLSSILTVPNYEKAINTKEQLQESHIPWAATSDAWIFSIQGAEQPIIKGLVESFHILSEDVLHKNSLTERYAFSIERLPYGHYAVGDYITSESMQRLQAMHYDIYYEFCILMSFKTWPMMENFDEFVLRVQQSGIQNAWEENVVTRYLNSKVQLQIALSRQRTNSNEPEVLTVHNILGVLMIWSLGITISITVFSIELLIDYFTKNKTKLLALV